MEITDYTDEKLKMIMNQYAARRAREKINYQKKKDDEIFKVSNRARSAKHYEKNKEHHLNHSLVYRGELTRLLFCKLLSYLHEMMIVAF